MALARAPFASVIGFSAAAGEGEREERGLPGAAGGRFGGRKLSIRGANCRF
jgi:hypothetical protein